MEEAIACLGSRIALAIADKRSAPKPPRPRRGWKLVHVPWWIAGKPTLEWAVRELGISQSELARRLGGHDRVNRR
jgi:hypothetical protein